MNRTIAFVGVSLALSVLGLSQAAAQGLPPQLQMDSQRAGAASPGATQLQTDSERYEDRASILAEKQKSQGVAATAYGQGYGGAGGGGDEYGYGGDGELSGRAVRTSVGRAAAVDLVNAAAGYANRAILTRDDDRGADLYVDQDGMIRNRERGGNGGDTQGR